MSARGSDPLIKGDRINAFVVAAYGAASLYLKGIETLQLRCIRAFCSLRRVEFGTGAATLPLTRNFVAETAIFVRNCDLRTK
jgi:hypothetical protein